MEIIRRAFFADNSLLFQKHACFIHRSTINFPNSVNQRKYIHLLLSGDKDRFSPNLINLLCILEQLYEKLRPLSTNHVIVF